MRKPTAKLSNRKIIFYNTTRMVECINCYCDLQESWVLSAPKERYRCLKCALHYNIILDGDIPEAIKLEMLPKEIPV